MRKKVLFLIVFLCSLSVFPQKSMYFKVIPTERNLFLYPVNGMQRPEGLKPPYDRPVSLKQERESIRDIQALLKEKFLGISDQDFVILKKVVYNIYFSQKGKVIYYEILFPASSEDAFPCFEKQLYEVAETLSTWDFSRYGLNIPFKDESLKQYGVIGFPLLWIKSNLSE